MRLKRIAVGGLAVVALAAGSAGAIAATGDDRREDEHAVLDAAAEQLDVTPEKLRSALSAAQDARLDQAVRDGELTQEQADEIKQRRAQDGRVLGMGPGRGAGHDGGPGHHGRGGHGGGGQLFEDLATALDLSRAELRARLQAGDSVAEIAKAEDKGLAEVKREVRAAQVKRLDAAVKAGRLTEDQRDAMVEHLDERIDRVGERRRGHLGRMPPAHDRGADDTPGDTDGAAGAARQPGSPYQ